MKRAGKWAIGIALTAAAAFATIQTVSNTNEAITTQTADPIISPVLETESPPPQTEPPASQGQECGYQWAYHNAPELTNAFDADIKELNANASGRVEFFGEDCIRADGTSTFLPMETDFYVRLQVDDLSKEAEFGDWLAKVMEIVLQIPQEQLSGKYGFVEFWFEKSETEHRTFRVPIQQYIDEAQGKSGAELFQMFSPQP